MNQRERFNRVMHFEPVDRAPNVEIGYWDHLPEAWCAQGVPAHIPWWPSEGDLQYSRNSRELAQYFGLDSHDIVFSVSLNAEEYPRPTEEIIAEDEDTLIIRYSNGSLIKALKRDRGIAQDLDWPVKNRRDWEATKRKYVAGWHNISPGGTKWRTPEAAQEALASLRNRDHPASLCSVGFFMKVRKLMGFEAACTVFFDDAGLAQDLVSFWTEYLLEHFKMALDVFTPDLVLLCEDMAYNHGAMLPPRTVGEFLVPGYAKLTSFLNSRGVDLIAVDSDGFVDELIPVLYDGGVNTWSPFEMVCRRGRDDLLALGRKYPWLRMIGGMDKLALQEGPRAIDEIVSLIPPLVDRGGYIPTIDHKVPEGVRLGAYQYYLAEKRKRLAGSGACS